MKTGYCITTKRFTMYCSHPEYLVRTEEIYHEVVLFYYRLMLEQPGMQDKNNWELLRQAELLSIPGRNKVPVPCPLPWDRIPMYFRRAAINNAIAMFKSLNSRENAAVPAEEIRASVVYYKGMYRELSEKAVELKVYDGSRWHWMHCRLGGNSFLPDEELLSPSVVLTSGKPKLHVPVRRVVEDARTARERMASGERLCSIQFANSDAFAVGCILDDEDRQIAVRFFTGGKEYSHRCRQLAEKICESDKARGAQPAEGEQANRKYWMHLKHLGEHYAHQVSRQILDFCREYDAWMIVMPASDYSAARPVMKASGNWSPFHLSFRIRSCLTYKAWQEGILVLEPQPWNAAGICAVCGGRIRKQGTEFRCENGHRGNRYLNAARNVGRQCRQDFRKKGQNPT